MVGGGVTLMVTVALFEGLATEVAVTVAVGSKIEAAGLAVLDTGVVTLAATAAASAGAL
jgi:hypothetical protein